MANKNFFVRNGLTVNNFTTISGTDGTISVGNAVITSTTLTVGNSVTNTTTISTPNIVVGNVIANTSTLTVGSNVVLATTGISLGNSTINAVSNSSLIKITGASTGTTVGPSGVTSFGPSTSSNTQLSFGGLSIQTSTSNLSIAATGVTLPDGNTINGVANSSYYYSNTLNKAVTVDGLWSSATLVTLTDGATITPDLSTGANFVVTLGGNRTVAAPTNAKPGQCGIILVKQDATGSRTLAWNAAWKWPGGTAPTLTTTASAVDKIFYLVETSSIIHASSELNSK